MSGGTQDLSGIKNPQFTLIRQFLELFKELFIQRSKKKARTKQNWFFLISRYNVYWLEH